MLQRRSNGRLRRFDLGDGTIVSQRSSSRLERVVQKDGARGIADTEVN